MLRLFKSLFRSEPGSKIRREKDRKYKQAVQLQRDGKLREYAKVIKELCLTSFPKITKLWLENA